MNYAQLSYMHFKYEYVVIIGAISRNLRFHLFEMILVVSLFQCTLEQIFLQFAKDQEEEQAAVAGMTISSNSVAQNVNNDTAEYKPLEMVDEV